MDPLSAQLPPPPAHPAPAAAPGVLPPELATALDLIAQGCELIERNSLGLSPEARRLRPAIALLQHATSIVAATPEAGQSATLRWRIYQLIQAQQSEDACFYKELRCAIHLGLCGEVGADPVTLPGCGHSYCRACIAPVLAAASPAQRKCPQCRVPISVPLDALRTTVAIKGVVDRLLPQGGGAGGGGGGGGVGGGGAGGGH